MNSSQYRPFVSDNRPDWDHYFADMLHLIGRRSTCERHHVGAIITVDNQIVATGYNGAPSGMKHCSELGGCMRTRDGIESGTHQEHCRAVHAEENAMLRAGPQAKGGVLYTSLQPCTICARKIINAKIVKVVFREGYPDQEGTDMLNEAGVEVLYLPEEPLRPEMFLGRLFELNDERIMRVLHTNVLDDLTSNPTVWMKLGV